MKKYIITLFLFLGLCQGVYALDYVGNYVTSTSTISNWTDTTGFNMDGVIKWIGTDLIKVFIGSMFLTLSLLKGWIIVGVSLGLLVYFVMRAFRFYNH
jgi:hypothetical protein